MRKDFKKREKKIKEVTWEKICLVWFELYFGV